MKLIIDFEERLWKELKSAMKHEPTSLDGYQQPIANGIPYEERPHGEWEQIPEREGEYYFYHKCTNCGQTIESGFNPPLFNFCPNCGSDNRPKEGEEK